MQKLTYREMKITLSFEWEVPVTEGSSYLETTILPKEISLSLTVNDSLLQFRGLIKADLPTPDERKSGDS